MWEMIITWVVVLFIVFGIPIWCFTHITSKVIKPALLPAYEHANAKLDAKLAHMNAVRDSLPAHERAVLDERTAERTKWFGTIGSACLTVLTFGLLGPIPAMFMGAKGASFAVKNWKEANEEADDARKRQAVSA